MSIDINWDILTTGADGQELSNSIRDFVHDKFQEIPLPGFIQSVNVVSFDLGTIAPDIEIQDICEPYPEFYEDTYAEGDDEDDEEAEEEEHIGEEELLKRERERKRKERQSGGGSTDFDAAYEAASLQVAALATGPHNLQPPPYGFRPAFSPAVDQLTPGFRPGHASNLHYFHSALSSSFSGALTPLASLHQAADGYGWPTVPHLNHTNSSLNQSHPLSNTLPLPPAPSRSSSSISQSPPSTTESTSKPAPPAPPPTTIPNLIRLRSDSSILSDGTREPPPTPFIETAPGNLSRNNSTTTSSHHDSILNIDDDQQPPRFRLREPRDTDMQLVARVRYSGDIRMEMTAELLIDYPAPNFVSLPVRLTLTGMTFDGTAIVAHIRNRAHFCFVDDGGASGDGGGYNGNNSNNNSNTGAGVGGMLREIKIESEIGEKGRGKQVLKNVGKIERFVLERVRRILEEEFVFPSSWTFLL